MAEDFRVWTSWASHWKRKRLRRALGPAGESAILCLWGYAASSHNRADGDLSGLANEDIADQADFEGDPDTLVTTLVDCKLLDGSPGMYRIHDWESHQGSLPPLIGFATNQEE